MSGIQMGQLAAYGVYGAQVLQKAAVSNKTSGTNNLNSGSIQLFAGRHYLVLLAWDPSGANVPTMSLSDTENTFTELNTQYTAPATTASGTGVITQAFIMQALTDNSRTITATSSAAITAKAMFVLEVRGITGSETNADVSTRGTTTGPSNFTTVSGNTNDLILSIVGYEQTSNNTFTGDSDTTNGRWSTIQKIGTTGGNTATNITLVYQYKVITATGTQSYSCTSSAQSNWGCVSFALSAA